VEAARNSSYNNTYQRSSDAAIARKKERDGKKKKKKGEMGRKEGKLFGIQVGVFSILF